MDAKELGNEAAHPNTFAQPDNSGCMTTKGLTKRELFAAMAMQGLCACNHPQIVAWSPEELALNARCQADALLAELAKAGEQ